MQTDWWEPQHLRKQEEVEQTELLELWFWFRGTNCLEVGSNLLLISLFWAIREKVIG